jgi:hypothetical protein
MLPLFEFENAISAISEMKFWELVGDEEMFRLESIESRYIIISCSLIIDARNTCDGEGKGEVEG